MTTKGQTQKPFKEIHRLLEKKLIQAADGTTKSRLHRETGVSRPTIDRHLKAFYVEGKVKHDGPLFFWVLNHKQLEQLERYRLIYEISVMEEKAEEFYRTEIAVVEDTLEGDALRKRLDEIHLGELNRRVQIFGEMKQQGVHGFEEKEAFVKDGLQLLQQLDKTPSVEKRIEMMRDFKVKLNKRQIEQSKV